MIVRRLALVLLAVLLGGANSAPVNRHVWVYDEVGAPVEVSFFHSRAPAVSGYQATIRSGNVHDFVLPASELSIRLKSYACREIKEQALPNAPKVAVYFKFGCTLRVVS